VRVAALDLGSNTFLLLIAEMQGDQIKNVLMDETRVTRLGQGVHQAREFHVDALARADQALAEFAQKIEEFGCEEVVAVATSAARDVKNGSELLKLGQKHRIPIRIISGADEAAITYDGATCDGQYGPSTVVIDVGGGSTEVIGQREGRPYGVSLDIGSVRLTEMFLPQHPCALANLKKMEDYILDQLQSAKDKLPDHARPALAVAGTPTSLAMLEQKSEFDEIKIHKTVMPVERIWQWRHQLAALTVEERQKLPGMQPKRADVLVAGATVLAMVADHLKAPSIMVSTKGVRYGVARAWRRLK
jgi:exopolyphosphatase/guanosine-5'-triphosphate,3'-diphosphate pyrophosphatase